MASTSGGSATSITALAFATTDVSSWRSLWVPPSRRRDCHFADTPSPPPPVETPTKRRAGCSRMPELSPTASPCHAPSPQPPRRQRARAAGSRRHRPCIGPNRKHGAPVSGWQQQLMSQIGVLDHAAPDTVILLQRLVPAERVPARRDKRAPLRAPPSAQERV